MAVIADTSTYVASLLRLVIGVSIALNPIPAPSNLPIIGRTRFPNLYLNTGHGTLGWTMACGAGQALADVLSGKVPKPNFRFLGVEQR